MKREDKVSLGALFWVLATIGFVGACLKHNDPGLWKWMVFASVTALIGCYFMKKEKP